jgi:hypothetical protein
LNGLQAGRVAEKPSVLVLYEWFAPAKERGQPPHAQKVPISEEVEYMEQNIDSNKSAARPSHEAVDTKLHDGKLTGKSARDRVDQTAMKAAKRAENRIVSNEERVPGDTLFTK